MTTATRRPAAERLTPAVPEVEPAPEVSVVIVTYNSAGVIRSCLETIPEALREHSYEVVVVDNASVDATRTVVRDAGVRLVACERNAGFAAGNNRGMDVARGAYVLLLNPDTSARPRSLDALVDVLATDPSVGVAAPRLLNVDGTDQQTARRFPTPAAAVLGRRSFVSRWFPQNPWTSAYLVQSHANSSESFEVDWVSGACLMTRRDVLNAVGGLDESFFMYWEDADWCRRVKAAGWSVVCVGGANVVHDEGARRSVSQAQVWQFHRSAYLYFRRYHLRGPWSALRGPAYALLGARAVAVVGARRVRRLLGGVVPA